MSGNFDRPPASASPSTDITSIPARFHNIRQTLQRDRDRDRQTWGHAAEQRLRDYRDMPPVTRSTSHRRPSGQRGAPPLYRNGRRVTHADEIPSSLGRRQRTPSRESYPISRARRGLTTTTREQYANLHPHLERHPSTTSERLDDINSSLHHLLDPSSFHQGSSASLDSYLDSLTADGRDEDRQRQKRRKLDHQPDSVKEIPNIRYGHFGQVVAGPLKMKLVSCDGGQYRDHVPGLHCPENVVRMDKSVYCTEKAQCTLLLEHLDGTSFSLEKLVIKGPDKLFTAPVQEGLVFVSTSPKSLISSASQYAIHYRSPEPRGLRRHIPAPPDNRQRSDTDHEHRLTLLEAINDSDMWETSQRRRNHSASSDDAGRESRTSRYLNENEESWGTADEILSGHLNDPNHPPQGTISQVPSPPAQLSPQDFRAPTPPPPPPQIRVTTSTNDPSISLTEEEEESTDPDILADRLIRENRMRNVSTTSAFHEDFNGAGAARYGPPSMYSTYASNDTDNTDGDDLLPPLERMWPDAQARESSPYARRPPPPSINTRDRWTPRRYPNGLPPPPPHMAAGAYAPHRRDIPSTIAPREHAEEMLAAEGGLVTPTAQFFIPKGKAAIAVKFDPPICGRWLCVRLFSPVMGGNIDVQSVVAYGFAGQRFFPACEPV